MATQKSAAGKKDQGKKGGAPLLFSVALGAALAAGAGYYAIHKEEIDREAKKRYDEMAKQFNQTRAEVEKRVKEIWGEVSHEAIATYMDARAVVLRVLEDENVQQAGKLAQKNYDKAVDLAMKEAKKHGLLDGSAERKLKAVLKKDWEKVQAAFNSSVKSASKAVKSQAKKATAQVKKARKPAKKAAGKVKKAVKKAAKPVKKAVKKKR